MEYLLQVPLIGICFLIVLNGFLRGLKRNQIDAALSFAGLVNLGVIFYFNLYMGATSISSLLF